MYRAHTGDRGARGGDAGLKPGATQLAGDVL